MRTTAIAWRLAGALVTMQVLFISRGALSLRPTA